MEVSWGDLSGPGSVLVVACGAAGSVMAYFLRGSDSAASWAAALRPAWPRAALTDAQPGRRRLAGLLAAFRPGRFRLDGGRLPRAGHTYRVAALAVC